MNALEYNLKNKWTRLPYNTPAKLALHHAQAHALKPTIRSRGQQKMTWISMMKNDSKNTIWQKNRNEWRNFVKQNRNFVFIIHNVKNLWKIFLE